MTKQIRPQNYAVDRWGGGYFCINAEGHACVSPRREQGKTIDLLELARQIRATGVDWPVLVRFMDILGDRIATVSDAFSSVFEQTGYQGGYRVVYPIKVNQQRIVVEEIADHANHPVGLEAGSKSELMAVLAHVQEDGLVICNGYKDAEYIRLALIGSKLTKRLFIVIEKPSELALILRESEALGIEPLLGVRMRLAFRPSGKWQDSGGVKSKFGLSAGQLLDLIDQLRSVDKLHCLRLLHSHMGSQIPNISDIRHAMSEVARVYAQMRELGAPIDVLDVGGGLGVDYEGTRTRSDCSVNYSPVAYATEVIEGIQRLCDAEGLPHPDLLSESGRALTAHHAVLITNVVESEAAPDFDPADLADMQEIPAPVERLHEAWQELGKKSVPTEVYQAAQADLQEALWLFEQGLMDLRGRALAEDLFFGICRRLLPLLRPSASGHRPLYDELTNQLANKIFCNFSLFQSLPDTWAINHVFPILPLQRLNEAPDQNATVHDLTCDSDGCIRSYVDQHGVESTLPMHALEPDRPYLLGMFLVGAYQEILGDIHNLFGDAHAINVRLDDHGGHHLLPPELGDQVDELLTYIHYDPARMLKTYRGKLERSSDDPVRRKAWYAELESGLSGYTYLEE